MSLEKSAKAQLICAEASLFGQMCLFGSIQTVGSKDHFGQSFVEKAFANFRREQMREQGLFQFHSSAFCSDVINFDFLDSVDSFEPLPGERGRT
jgi:hypothetical protein